MRSNELAKHVLTSSITGLAFLIFVGVVSAPLDCPECGHAGFFTLQMNDMGQPYF